MIVAGWEGGVRIELDETEAYALADFFHDVSAPSAPRLIEIVSARLDDVLGIERR